MSSAESLVVATPQSAELGFSTGPQFEHMQRVARLFAESQLVPSTFQKNVQNVAIALEMSQRIGCSPLMVMQNLNIIHGKPSFGASFMIATVNACGRFTPLRFIFVGAEGQDDWGCYAVAKAKLDSFECRGVTITMSMAKAEGWVQKSGSKWKTMPQLMLQYRAATFWTRAFAPEILMGFPTQDEILDVETTPATEETPATAAEEVPPTTRKRAKKGVSELKAAEPVTSEPAAAPSTDSSSSEPAPSDQASEPASEPTPASTPAPEPNPPAVVAPSEPAPAPAPAAASESFDLLPRCELVKSEKRGEGVYEVTLKGDINGSAFYQQSADKPALPSDGALIDVVIVEKPSRRSGAPLKVIQSFTVVA